MVKQALQTIRKKQETENDKIHDSLLLLQLTASSAVMRQNV